MFFFLYLSFIWSFKIIIIWVILYILMSGIILLVELNMNKVNKSSLMWKI